VSGTAGSGPSANANANDPAEQSAAEPDETSAARLLDRRGRLRLAFAPIADLARGTICGYEAVERFPNALTPDAWRAEAIRRRLEPDLDAFAIESILHARESLPPDCFLSFDVRPATLLREPVRRVLARAERLDGLVFELSPRIARRDQVRLATAVGELRAAGATFAIDDLGGDDAVMRQAALVRPEFVKLAPALVQGIHRDDVRRVLLDGIGRLASHFDAWVVAQGVADVADLDTLLQLRVPLAQGPLVGVVGKTLTPVAFVLSAYVRERGAAMRSPGSLAALVELLPVLTRAERDEASAAFADDERLAWIPLVDARGRPAGMVERAAQLRGEPPADEVLAISAASDVAEVAHRAMLRALPTRFHPLVCCDVRGRYVGVVRVERLVEALALPAG
jgi:EAL domain-containing protein (putative c-di-GMP-specific phosphodiesterase class I)